MKKMMAVLLMVVVLVSAVLAQNPYGLNNPACLPDSLTKHKNCALLMNNGGTVTLIYIPTDTLGRYLITAYHYIYSDSASYPEGSYMEIDLEAERESCVCGIDQMPVYRKKIHCLVKVEKKSSYADQIIYKIINYYGETNFIIDTWECGHVFEMLYNTQVVMFGHPQDGQGFFLKRVNWGHISCYTVPDGRRYASVFDLQGLTSTGSSGSLIMNIQGQAISTYAGNKVGRLLGDDPRIEQYLGQPIGGRYRKWFIKQGWPMAAYFENIKLTTNNYNIIRLEANVGWTANQNKNAVGCQVWMAVDNSAFFKVDSITVQKGKVVYQDTLDFHGRVRYMLRPVYSYRYNQSEIVEAEVYVPTMTDVDKTPPAVPKGLVISNYPNPFNSSTTINYTVEEGGPVKLQVFNIAGQLVATLVDEQKFAGSYLARWQANNVPSGTYFSRLTTESGVETRKILLQK